MKKLLSLFIVFAVVFSFSACGVGEDDEYDENSLTIMGKKSDLAKSYMTEIFERYKKTAGKNINIISIEDSEYEVEAERRFSEGNIPDIFMHFNNADLNRFDTEDNFCYLNDEKWVDDLTDSAKAYCTDSDGNLLGLPYWESSVSGCYYNKKIFSELGLKPATNQAEFDVLCDALKSIGYTPICWPADGCSWMVQFGLDPVFADDPSILEKINRNEIKYADIPQVNDMVRWIADAADKGWFGNKYLETGMEDISTVMSSGEAAMIFIWDTWFYTDLQKDGKYSVDDFALMPVFMNTAENGTYEGGNLNMMMVNKNSDKKQEALEFLEFCASSDNYNAAFDGISTVSCFKGQTTNIQSHMVTEASMSLAEYERVSTAATRVVGYSAEEVCSSLNKLFKKEISVSKCIELMDEYRIKEARAQGIENF